MKIRIILLSFMLLLSLSACAEKQTAEEQSTSLPSTEITETLPKESETPKESEKPQETAEPENPVPEDEADAAYQAIKTIENCTDPDELESLLEEIYGEDISCIMLDYREEGTETFNGYEEPYDDFQFFVTPLSEGGMSKEPITSDSYAFFREYQESPVFIMDEDGAYLVEKYEIDNFEDGTHVHKVLARSATELYLALHGYLGEESEKEGLAETVRGIEKYTAFEQLINEYVK